VLQRKGEEPKKTGEKEGKAYEGRFKFWCRQVLVSKREGNRGKVKEEYDKDEDKGNAPGKNT